MRLFGGEKESQLLSGSVPTNPGRRGAKKAIGAVATAMLTAIWHMLTNGTLYQDLGGDYFDQRAKATQTKRLVGRLQQLGYDVTIAPQEG